MEKRGMLSRIGGMASKWLWLYNPLAVKARGIFYLLLSLLVIAATLIVILGVWWSRTPALFDVKANAAVMAKEIGAQPVTGFTTTATLIQLGETLLDKPGGYLSNDVMPPGVFLDNMPNLEFGILVQIRDMARVMRNDFSRSQSQSVEDKDLIVAEPQFNFDSESWILPDTEGEYRKAITALKSYLRRLSNKSETNAQFYARADNLRDWLSMVEKRLGSLSTRLSASVGQERLNTDLAGDAAGSQSTPAPGSSRVKTPWNKIDDVFFEARGQSWALIELLKAAEVDFAGVLEKKNARVSLQQIIRELENTQDAIWSPIILNGRGFAFVANHSLIMASYISRANAALIDLKNLLENG